MKKQSWLAVLVSLSMVLTPVGAAASGFSEDEATDSATTEILEVSDLQSDISEATDSQKPDTSNEIPEELFTFSSEDEPDYNQALIIQTDEWTVNDFVFEGTVVTGLSASGESKRAENNDLVIPDYNADGEAVTEIAAGPAASGGLFATADEKFDSVTLPATIIKIGNNAFRDAGLTQIEFPDGIQEIGTSAFMMNSLSEVVLPNSLTVLGSGASPQIRICRT